MGLVTGRKRRERKASSLTHHKLRRASKTGELISWEKQITVLSEEDELSPIEKAAMEKRRRSFRRNSELVSDAINSLSNLNPNSGTLGLIIQTKFRLELRKLWFKLSLTCISDYVKDARNFQF